MAANLPKVRMRISITSLFFSIIIYLHRFNAAGLNEERQPTNKLLTIFKSC